MLFVSPAVFVVLMLAVPLLLLCLTVSAILFIAQ
jgi:hypothetical protein